MDVRLKKDGVSKVANVSYLGIVLDSKLSWKLHIAQEKTNIHKVWTFPSQ